MTASSRSRIVGSLVLVAVILVAVVVGVGVSVAGSGAAPLPVEDVQRRVMPTTRIRVEVLNAGGVTDLARDATEYLRDSGFDVVDFGNARDFDADSSIVLDRVGQDEIARAVADALGIDNVRSKPDSNLYVDVSVLLGSDWRRPDPPEADGPEPQSAWWDPRGWFGR